MQEDECVLCLTLLSEYSGLVSRIVNLTKANLDALQLEKSTYVQQFYEAMNVNGGDLETATFLDYIMHFLTFFWKVRGIAKPASLGVGGWCFFYSLNGSKVKAKER